MDNSIEWKDVEQNIQFLTPVEGGYSKAIRGIVSLGDQTCFVKIGVDDSTKAWAKKEVQAYTFLLKAGYEHCPKLLSVNSDQTSFAIEALLQRDGWDWSDVWTVERLTKTFDAMDALAAITLTEQDTMTFKEGMGMTDAANGWVKLERSKIQQEYLMSKLAAIDRQDIILHLHEHVTSSVTYNLVYDTLLHFDVRADNCAWNSVANSVKLVDWNWLQIGDKTIDHGAFLVYVHTHGLDVTKVCPERLNRGALHWLAGFWFEATSKPGSEKLRDMQLTSALTALQLSTY